MPNLLFVALVGVAAWYGWRSLRRQQAQVTEALRRADEALARKEPIKLEKDPETGVYRPADRRR
jgi:hypothetical protein